MNIKGKLVDELLSKGIDLESFGDKLSDFIQSQYDEKPSKKTQDMYDRCVEYYNKHRKILEGTYNIKRLYIRDDQIRIESEGSDSWALCFLNIFFGRNSIDRHDTLKILEELVERRDDWAEWKGIITEIYNRCIDIDSHHHFRIIKGKGLLLTGSGWNNDAKWLVGLGKYVTNMGGTLLEGIETAQDFRDLIRFRGLLGGVKGCIKALKDLGDIYDLLDDKDVRVLKRILKKHDDDKRIYLGNKTKRAVMV